MKINNISALSYGCSLYVNRIGIGYRLQLVVHFVMKFNVDQCPMFNQLFFICESDIIKLVSCVMQSSFIDLLIIHALTQLKDSID